MTKYSALLVKIGVDMILGLGHKSHAWAIDNFNLLVDIKVLLSLALFIPLVNAVHALIKLSQARDIFVLNFLQMIKLCQNELARFSLTMPLLITKTPPCIQ